MHNPLITPESRCPMAPVTPIDFDGEVRVGSRATLATELLLPDRIERPDRILVASPSGPTCQIPEYHPLGPKWSELSADEKRDWWIAREQELAYETLPPVGKNGLADYAHLLFGVSRNLEVFLRRLDAASLRAKSPHTSGWVFGGKLNVKAGEERGRLRDGAAAIVRGSLGTVDKPGLTQPGVGIKLPADGDTLSGDGVFYVGPMPVKDPDTFFSSRGREAMRNFVGAPRGSFKLGIANFAFSLVDHPGHRTLQTWFQEDGRGGYDPDAVVPEVRLRPTSRMSMNRLEKCPSVASQRYDTERLDRFRQSIQPPPGYEVADVALDEIKLSVGPDGKKRAVGDRVWLTIRDPNGDLLPAQYRVTHAETREVVGLGGDKPKPPSELVLRARPVERTAELRTAIRATMDVRLELQRRVRPGDIMYHMDLVMPDGRVRSDVATLEATSEAFISPAGDGELALHHLGPEDAVPQTRARRALQSLASMFAGGFGALGTKTCPMGH